MNGDRKTLGWPWIVALLVGLPVLYVASFGPARGAYVHRRMPEWTYTPSRYFYLPILWAMPRLPDSIVSPYIEYIGMWQHWCDPTE